MGLIAQQRLPSAAFLGGQPPTGAVTPARADRPGESPTSARLDSWTIVLDAVCGSKGRS
jgi:hypothetical protein